MTTFTIRVPASSANIGPGFDSAGIAIQRFLTLDVTPSSEWKFIHNSKLLPPIRHYKDHFIYKVAKQVAESYHKELLPAHVQVDSEIPLARGLGSSASAIIAGIELANQLLDLQLSTDDKLMHATKIEGHPDNVAAALLGGFVIAVQLEDQTEVDYIKLPQLDLNVVVYIPNVELKTTDARKVLPKRYPAPVATSASAISNIMLTSLLTGNYELSGKMMEEDRFHEPYRAKLIPNYESIRKNARQLGAYGTIISGAGPTMISFVPKEKGNVISKQMQETLTDYKVLHLSLDENGLYVSHK